MLLALAMLLACGGCAVSANAAEGAEAAVGAVSGEASGDASWELILQAMASEEAAFDASAYTALELISPDNDFRTDLQYSYVMDDVTNVYAYAHGVEQLSLPRGVICDFSEEVDEADSYVIQYASDADFSDAVTVEGLTEPSYAVQNLLLGEHFYWRGGSSLDTIENSPVHEVTVTDVPPRICYVEGVTNLRDVGGYESSLVEGGKIRQGLYYRSENLNTITEEGQRVARDVLGIRVEIDMRDEDLCLGPYIEGVEYCVHSIPSATEARRFEEFSSVYKAIFELIADADENPVLLHCSSGADRTGIVTFMLLTVCGVSYEDAARDYLFTNFTDERIRELDSEFNNWYAKLDYFAGDTKAEQAKNWLMLKGVSEEDIEHIREIFVEGYTA